MDDNISANPYYKHFLTQVGGELPVFRGSTRYQRGDGIGDIFRAIGRFLIPIALNAGKKFIGHTAQSLQKGQTLQEAAKSSILPTLSTAAMTAVDTIKKGGGCKRKRSAVQKKVYKKQKMLQNQTLQKRRKRVKEYFKNLNYNF